MRELSSTTTGIDIASCERPAKDSVSQLTNSNSLSTTPSPGELSSSLSKNASNRKRSAESTGNSAPPAALKSQKKTLLSPRPYYRIDMIITARALLGLSSSLRRIPPLLSTP